jgi:hypothetical protein
MESLGNKFPNPEDATMEDVVRYIEDGLKNS